MGIRWSEKEKKILTKNYESSTREKLQELLPKRTPVAINLMARIMGIGKNHEYHDHRRESNLSILLEDTHLSYYWMGFLMADGHFSKKNRLQVSLGIQDKGHLIKFAQYIKCNNIDCGEIKCNLKAQDIHVLPKVKEKFDIHHQKTYNPSKYIINDDKLFLSFLIGFIDGDGWIRYQTGRTDYVLGIKLHGAWLDWLINLIDRLSNISGIKIPLPIINNQGYARLHITNLELIQYLKQQSIEYNLPILNRKWDKIDLTKISRYRITKDKIPKIKKMLEQGHTMKNVAKTLHTTHKLVKSVKDSL